MYQASIRRCNLTFPLHLDGRETHIGNGHTTTFYWFFLKRFLVVIGSIFVKKFNSHQFYSWKIREIKLVIYIGFFHDTSNSWIIYYFSQERNGRETYFFSRQIDNNLVIISLEIAFIATTSFCGLYFYLRSLAVRNTLPDNINYQKLKLQEIFYKGVQFFYFTKWFKSNSFILAKINRDLGFQKVDCFSWTLLTSNECLKNLIKLGEPNILCSLDMESAYDYVN